MANQFECARAHVTCKLNPMTLHYFVVLLGMLSANCEIALISGATVMYATVVI